MIYNSCYTSPEKIPVSSFSEGNLIARAFFSAVTFLALEVMRLNGYGHNLVKSLNVVFTVIIIPLKTSYHKAFSRLDRKPVHQQREVSR